jgi:hypothetical protein
MSQMGQAATWRLIRDESVHPSISDIVRCWVARRLAASFSAAMRRWIFHLSTMPGFRPQSASKSIAISSRAGGRVRAVN